MSRSTIEFKTSDGVTLRGWFYAPRLKSSSKLPCVVLSHGFSALKEMDLDAFAECFTTKLAITCVVYDNRGFGESDTGPNQPRHEILPDQQVSDMSDAITYAQTREEVDPERIALWGSSYSGGNVLRVGAVDRRVKAVLSQAPCVNGWDNFKRLVRPDFAQGMDKLFQQGTFPDHRFSLRSQQIGGLSLSKTGSAVPRVRRRRCSRSLTRTPPHLPHSPLRTAMNSLRLGRRSRTGRMW